jgi:hypothetical protein
MFEGFLEATVRNAEMAKLSGLVGTWRLTISDAWFLKPEGTTVPGEAVVEWVGESLLMMRLGFDEGHAHSHGAYVVGRSDANDRFVALYEDDRGVCREFAMTFGAGEWTLVREDPDFHQRFIGEVGGAVIRGRWEASDDAGLHWRKDFDLTFERV